MALPKIYTVDEVAEILRVDRSTVYRKIDRGELRASRIGAKQVWRITETAVLEVLGEVTA